MNAPWRIERLVPGLRDDYLAFFDHDRGPAFAGDEVGGTMSIFTAVGFTELARHEDLTIVRKLLR